MRLILIRHGEPDYTGVTDRRFIGHGRDLGPLTEKGARQAEEASRDERLRGAQLIVSSPYTRAMQTAAIISRSTNLPLTVEMDLHEWLPDTTFQYDSEDYENNACRECTMFKGVPSPEAGHRWESLSHVAERAYSALYKYLEYEKIIVVAHGFILRQFVFRDHIPHCGILETEFSRDFKWQGFHEESYERFK